MVSGNPYIFWCVYQFVDNLSLSILYHAYLGSFFTANRAHVTQALCCLWGINRVTELEHMDWACICLQAAMHAQHVLLPCTNTCNSSTSLRGQLQLPNSYVWQESKTKRRPFDLVLLTQMFHEKKKTNNPPQQYSHCYVKWVRVPNIWWTFSSASPLCQEGLNRCLPCWPHLKSTNFFFYGCTFSDSTTFKDFPQISVFERSSGSICNRWHNAAFPLKWCTFRHRRAWAHWLCPNAVICHTL